MGMTFFALEMLQSVVLFGTLAAGFLVLLFLMLDNCKHTVITVVIVTTGLVHELYCASVLGYFKRLMQIETLRPKDDGCRDFFVPTLIANAIFVTIITTHVVRAGSFIRNKSTVYNLIVVHALLSISLIIWQNPEKSLHQTASMNLTSEVQVYFTVCRNSVVQNSSHILMEYILYYLPLVCFYVWTASQLSTADAGISFWNIAILKSCAQRNATCSRCYKMNYAFQIVLFYIGVGVVIARPFQLLYGVIHSEPVIDVIPSLSNTVVYSFLSLEYLTDFSHVKHVNMPH
uniref:Uncharacterized protein n=1 Tax=Magallana gigas TaxID=29159 RepID=A0A8W8ISL2_MAGGI|nr:uncharacterized protein LOC105325641 [Crassostrea gigas]XP_034328225.1 uncharacterized protein LOC105325641 [Crassostrea gigas]XP_034328226.1 uncharacterized protein LOC105325641 [Crassostrea gigas]XP_034328227.1 uncharacterized protein LOC105325641 [Crassostrea gigas]